jgi:hypothetical protein
METNREVGGSSTGAAMVFVREVNAMRRRPWRPAKSNRIWEAVLYVDRRTFL